MTTLKDVLAETGEEGHSLRTFLAGLDGGDILALDEPVDLDFGPTALVLELEKAGRAPVVSFTDRVTGLPLVANLFGDRKRIAAIAGTDQEGFRDAWIRAMEEPLVPVIVEAGPVHDNVMLSGSLDAAKLPISRHFTADAGRYIGSGVLVSKDPDTGARNLSYQRMQLKGPDRFGVSMHSRGHIWDYYQRWKARGQDMEVAVVIGPHPSVNLAGAAKVAMDVDEYELAGGLMRRPVELVRCRTIDMEVPANAEFVLEGRILADEQEDEGPYGEYTGYSTYRSTRNIFQVTAITHRDNPLFHDIIPGYSAEHLLLSRSPREPYVFHRLKEAVPQVTGLFYPKSGTHFHAYIGLKKTAEGQARQALMMLFGLDPYVKFAVAVDDDIALAREEEVLWAMATRFQADTDMFVVPNVLCNRLDPSSREGMSAKLGLDATAPLEWDVERNELPEAAIAWAREQIRRSGP